jgi:membrane protease YdiL (CAAX protease family)
MSSHADTVFIRRFTPTMQAALFYAVLAAFWLAHGLGAPEELLSVLDLLWGVAAVLLVLRVWRPPLPLRAPLFRIAVATPLLLLILFGLHLVTPGANAATDGGGTSTPVLVLTALLMIPALVGHELFFRGHVYEAVLRRWGAQAAVLAAAALPALVIAPAAPGLSFVGAAFVAESLLSLSRAATGSLAPGLAAQVLIGVGGATFVVLMLVSAG